MKKALLAIVLLVGLCLIFGISCSGNDKAPNGMTASEILAMCHNASASINTSKTYMTETLDSPISHDDISSFTSRDKINHAFFLAENHSTTISSGFISETSASTTERYIINNSWYEYDLFVGETNISKWIRTESEVDLWDNSLYQECINRSADANYMGTEIIEGIDCYKIGLKHDLAAVSDILEYFCYDGSGLDSGLDNGGISNLECTIYIDKNTYYPIKTSLIYNIMSHNSAMKVSSVGNLSCINQPVSIVLPEAAKNATVISFSDYTSGNW